VSTLSTKSTLSSRSSQSTVLHRHHPFAAMRIIRSICLEARFASGVSVFFFGIALTLLVGFVFSLAFPVAPAFVFGKVAR
jgi:hypothetical protein